MRVKNIDTVSETYAGMLLTASQEYTLESSEINRWATSDKVLDAISSGKLQVGNDTDWITGTSNQINELTGNIIKTVKVEAQPAFASKYVGTSSLFKRVHGANTTVDANSTENITISIPYGASKFSGAEIIGCQIKDTINFKILDTATNTYSGLDVPTYGANFKLNQFGFDVEMPKDFYKNSSNYDADLLVDMVICCEYTNNSNAAVYIAVNFELHEVK